MSIDLLPGESIVKEGPANLQRGWETVGGRLVLTTGRLVFVAHRFNIATGVTEIQLADIDGARLCWTRFLNLIPLTPNSLAVTVNGGAEFKFVLWGRVDWMHAIGAERMALTLGDLD